MANDNLFEKYGIKEVCDVTFFRIEKKEETYEVQRDISVSSILRSAIELQTVYPMTEGGVGDENGFQAYVFTNADIHTLANYDCDDDIEGNEEDKKFGIYDDDVSDGADHNVKDPKKSPGTHEYSYAEQVCMLFARKQNLISKAGVRYQFKNVENLFGQFTFNDNFAVAPHSTEKIVVVALGSAITENTYDVEAVNESIKGLTQTIKTKAYDVTYSDYAELIVEDEMGYFNPGFMGYLNNDTVKFFTKSGGESYAQKYATNLDYALANITMWESGNHYSINDAIDALKQKQKILDVSEAAASQKLGGIFGGYKVTEYTSEGNVVPTPGEEDTKNSSEEYKMLIGGVEKAKSQYPLNDVLDAINQIAISEGELNKDLKITTTGKASNRAIYVKIDNSVDTAAGAFIYLLTNKNANKLYADTDGIFSFEDKKGNKLCYQDKIFKGVEYLALVVLGNKGLIFVVNRNGKKTSDKIAWMVNENGYVTNLGAKTLVTNGLIHTLDITEEGEIFEATCTVKGLKARKTIKQTNRYVPVLFLDTLKVSTLEQTAENVYAQGGKGNGRLIGWDYGKTITLSLQDALFTPTSMSMMFGGYDENDTNNGVKETKVIDRMEKVFAKRNFIVPAGNSEGTPSEADKSAQAVFYDPNTMMPYQDGTPIAEGEMFYKFTRSVAYEGQSIGNTIEISAEKFPGTYKVVGDTYIRAKEGGADERFQIVIPQAKMTSEQTITLEADGDPSVFDMNLEVLRPEDGVMVRLIQYNVVENEEENDGSTMVKDTENLNLLDSAELFKVNNEETEEETAIGATEF